MLPQPNMSLSGAGRRFSSLRLKRLRLFSTEQAAVAAGDQDDASVPTKQPFVRSRIRPGEWDPETRTNPLYRPKFRSNAKIWSNDDFNRQPRVGFSADYASFQEAQVTLTWMTQDDHRQVYQFYCDLMESSEIESKRTSHEYIVRVVGQRYQITPERVAAIVQLQHNEQQMIRRKNAGDTSVKLYTELADHMDAAIQTEIRNAYKSFRLAAPEDFVEDPIPDADKEGKPWQLVDDLFDVDELTRQAVIRDESRARLIIDNYVYIEDVEDDSVEIPMSKDCESLLTQQSNLKEQSVEESPHEPLHESGTRRPRWKYVAQIVNTREQRKKQLQGPESRSKRDKPSRSYTNNNPANTLVESNGELRAATRTDVQQTSWKATRNVCEHTYRGVKQGWLDRRNRGDATAWGMAPEEIQPPRTSPVITAMELSDADLEEAQQTEDDDDDPVEFDEERDKGDT